MSSKGTTDSPPTRGLRPYDGTELNETTLLRAALSLLLSVPAHPMKKFVVATKVRRFKRMVVNPDVQLGTLQLAASSIVKKEHYFFDMVQEKSLYSRQFIQEMKEKQPLSARELGIEDEEISEGTGVEGEQMRLTAPVPTSITTHRLGHTDSVMTPTSLKSTVDPPTGTETPQAQETQILDAGITDRIFAQQFDLLDRLAHQQKLTVEETTEAKLEDPEKPGMDYKIISKYVEDSRSLSCWLRPKTVRSCGDEEEHLSI